MRRRSAAAATLGGGGAGAGERRDLGAPVHAPGPGQAAWRSTAGATRSGFWRPSAVGPHDENEATPPGAGARAARRARLTRSPGRVSARRSSAPPWRAPSPTTGIGRPMSPGTAGKARVAVLVPHQQRAGARGGGAAGGLGERRVAAGHEHQRARRAAAARRGAEVLVARRPRPGRRRRGSATSGSVPGRRRRAHQRQGPEPRGARGPGGRRGGPCAAPVRRRRAADGEHRRAAPPGRRRSRAARTWARRCRRGPRRSRPPGRRPPAPARPGRRRRRRSRPRGPSRITSAPVRRVAVAVRVDRPLQRGQHAVGARERPHRPPTGSRGDHPVGQQPRRPRRARSPSRAG